MCWAVEKMAEKRNVVLFVDDEQHILNAIRRATFDESFDTVFAGSGATALEAFEQQEISVIVTDMRMPVMDGLTLLKIVREKYPSTVRIVLSGYTQLTQVLSSINQGEIFQFIPKPWQMEEELLWTIRRAIERYNMETERNSLQASLTKKNAAYVHILQEMDQKLANERRDIAGFKNINHWTFHFWKQRLASCFLDSSGMIEDMESQFYWVEKIQNAYMEILPTTFATRDYSQLAAELRLSSSGRVRFQTGPATKVLVGGCFSFAMLLFGIVLELHGAETDDAVLIKALNTPQSGEKNKLIFEGIPSAVALEKQLALEICYSLLDTIGQPYGFGLLPQKHAGKITGVHIGWQLQFPQEPSAER